MFWRLDSVSIFWRNPHSSAQLIKLVSLSRHEHRHRIGYINIGTFAHVLLNGWCLYHKISVLPQYEPLLGKSSVQDQTRNIASFLSLHWTELQSSNINFNYCSAERDVQAGSTAQMIYQKHKGRVPCISCMQCLVQPAKPLLPSVILSCDGMTVILFT
jgi:hypothetical protein